MGSAASTSGSGSIIRELSVVPSIPSSSKKVAFSLMMILVLSSSNFAIQPHRKGPTMRHIKFGDTTGRTYSQPMN